MKNKIPISLIISRLLLGFVILLLGIFYTGQYKVLTVILLSIGLLTDIFDGIIARRLNISTQKLRRLDSTIDQLFFICVIVAAYFQSPQFFKNNWLLFIVLVIAECLTYVVCFLKFRKEIATHTIGAKIWTLILFSTLIQVILQGDSFILFQICFYTGLLTRAEIIAIILALKSWTNDVPTLYHAIRLRHNKPIKRNKIFNG